MVSLSLSLSLYIYIYVCVCVCSRIVKGMQDEINTHIANASFQNVAKFEYFGTIN